MASADEEGRPGIELEKASIDEQRIRELIADAEEAAREQRWEDAEQLFRQALDTSLVAASVQGSDQPPYGPGSCTELTYLEGRLGNALIRLGRQAEARHLLERSLDRPCGVPRDTVRMLTRICFEQSDWGCAEAALRRYIRTGPSSDDDIAAAVVDAIVGLAKAGVRYVADEPLSRAERWAAEVADRELEDEVAYRRGRYLEAVGDGSAALAWYQKRVGQGSVHDEIRTRLMILLERMGSHETALDATIASIGQGGSAAFEERARARAERLRRKLAPPGARPPKTRNPAFSVRRGSLTLIGQRRLTGGAQWVREMRSLVLARTGGKDASLFSVGRSLGRARRLGASTGGSLVASPTGGSVISITSSGNATAGRATISTVGSDWTERVTFEVDAVATEVVALRWGIAVGARDGALYAFDWKAEPIWAHDVPHESDEESPEQPFPYHVSGARGSGSVVYSAKGDVVCLAADGETQWTWAVPDAVTLMPGIVITGYAYASSIHATSDGGAWVAGTLGHAYRIDEHGALLDTRAGSDRSSWLLVDQHDRLAAISDFSGVSFCDDAGQPAGAFVADSLLELQLSSDGRHISGTVGRDLYLFTRDGSVVAHAEFSGRIRSHTWSDDRIYVAAGRLVCLGLEL